MQAVFRRIPGNAPSASVGDSERPTLRARRRLIPRQVEAAVAAVTDTVTDLIQKFRAVFPWRTGDREGRVPVVPANHPEERNGRKRKPLPTESVVTLDSDHAENIGPLSVKRMRSSREASCDDDGVVIVHERKSAEVMILHERTPFARPGRAKRLVKSPTICCSVTEPSGDCQVVEETVKGSSSRKSVQKPRNLVGNHVGDSAKAAAGPMRFFDPDCEAFFRSCHVTPASGIKYTFGGRRSTVGAQLPATTSRILNGHASPPPRVRRWDTPKWSPPHTSSRIFDRSVVDSLFNNPRFSGSPVRAAGPLSSTPFANRRKPVEVDLTAERDQDRSIQGTSRGSWSPSTVRRSKDGVSFAAYAEMLAREDEPRKKDREEKIQWATERVKELNDVSAKAQRALAESLRVKLRVTEVVLEEEEIEEVIEEGLDIEYQLAPLSREAEIEVKSALVPNPKEQLLSEKFSIPIRRKDIVTLAPGAWLNDEIINFYLNMVMERSGSENGRYPSAFAHQTFFFSTLASKGYSSVRRWTRRVDIFSKDLVLIPVHLQVHWTAVVVNLKEKVVEFFDSMGSKRWDIVDLVLNYIRDEMKDKKNQELDTSEWKREIPDVPQQKNGWDCGVFACKFLEYRSRKAPLDFSQAEMPYFRRRMVWEILNKSFYRPS